MNQFDLVASEEFDRNLAELKAEEQAEVLRRAELLRTNPGMDVASKTSIQSGDRRFVVYTGWDLWLAYRQMGNTTIGLVACGRHPRSRPGLRL